MSYIPGTNPLIEEAQDGSVGVSSSSNFHIMNFEPYIIAPKNSDIRVVAKADTAGTEVSAFIQGYLAKVVA